MKHVVEIDHRLSYEYDQPVALSEQLIRLRPSISVTDYRLMVAPAAKVSWRRSPRDCRAAVVAPMAAVKTFEIRSKFTAELDDAPPRPAGPVMDACMSVHGRVRYTDRGGTGVQEPGETLARGTGTCRDFAWLLADVLGKQGLMARFVSGYYVNVPLMSAELHAWVEVWHRDEWVGLDPTQGVPVGGCHIPIASAAHWRYAVPVAGTVEPETATTFTWELACRHV